jgi:hypothetical protein
VSLSLSLNIYFPLLNVSLLSAKCRLFINTAIVYIRLFSMDFFKKVGFLARI